MFRSILIGIAITVVLIIGLAILGLVVGAVIGGNFFTDFEFANVRGYEATGNLGAIIGAVIGLIAGIIVSRKIASSKKR
jgi:membrane associated rhomboid family serine protease